MLHKGLSDYLQTVQAAINKLNNVYVEQYEEEIIAPDRITLRIRVRFQNGAMLALNEAIIVNKEHLKHLGFRYHFQDRQNNLIFRYDNTPHFPKLESFPNHKHLPDTVIEYNKPTILSVIKEVQAAQ
jgi:hypothetical protein